MAVRPVRDEDVDPLAACADARVPRRPVTQLGLRARSDRRPKWSERFFRWQLRPPGRRRTSRGRPTTATAPRCGRCPTAGARTGRETLCAAAPHAARRAAAPAARAARPRPGRGPPSRRAPPLPRRARRRPRPPRAQGVGSRLIRPGPGPLRPRGPARLPRDRHASATSPSTGATASASLDELRLPDGPAGVVPVARAALRGVPHGERNAVGAAAASGVPRPPPPSSSTTTACCSTPRRPGRAPRSRCSRRHGATFTFEHKRDLIGSSHTVAAGKLEAMLGQPGRGPALMDELHALVMEEARHDIEPRPGAVELVDALRDGGHRRSPSPATPRATSSTASCAGAGVADRFAVTVAGDEVARPKPAPDIYLEACRRLGADPAASVGLEDSPTGAAAAKAAGLTVIGVPVPRRHGGPARRRDRRLAGRCRRARGLRRPRTLAAVTPAAAAARHRRRPRRLLRRGRAVLRQPRRRSAGARCCSGCCASAIYLTIRSRAFYNVLRAAYPTERIEFKRIWGAYIAAYGFNNVVPARGGDVIKLFLVKTSVPELDLLRRSPPRSSSSSSSTRRWALFILTVRVHAGRVPQAAGLLQAARVRPALLRVAPALPAVRC